MQEPFWLQQQAKLFSSFQGRFTLKTSSNTLRVVSWTHRKLCLFWKLKWYLDIKLVAFQQFKSEDPKLLIMGVFLFRKFSVDFRRFRVFIFCHRAYSKTRIPCKILFSLFFEVRFYALIFENTETTESSRWFLPFSGLHFLP